MCHLYVVASCEVGDGAGNLQDAVVGAGGEVHADHCGAEHGDTGFVWLGKLVYHLLGHLRIAVDAGEVLEAFFLLLTRLYCNLLKANSLQKHSYCSAKA